MAIRYIKSKNIKIFPCSGRGVETDNNGNIIENFNLESRLNTERNLTHLHWLGSGIESYVLEAPIDTENNFIPGTLKLVIGGYYCEIIIEQSDIDDGWLTRKNLGRGTWLAIKLRDCDLDSNSNLNRTKVLDFYKDGSSGTTILDQKDSTDGEYYFYGLAVYRQSYRPNDADAVIELRKQTGEYKFNTDTLPSIDGKKIRLSPLNFKNGSTTVGSYVGGDELNVVNGTGINISGSADSVTFGVDFNTVQGKLVSGNTEHITIDGNNINALWRPVKVNGTQVLSSTGNEALNLINGNGITIAPSGTNIKIQVKSASGGKITVDDDGVKHNTTNIGESTTPGLAKITYDNYGHITSVTTVNGNDIVNINGAGDTVGNYTHSSPTAQLHIVGVANRAATGATYSYEKSYAGGPCIVGSNVYSSQAARNDTESSDYILINKAALYQRIRSGTSTPTGTAQIGDIYIQYQ